MSNDAYGYLFCHFRETPGSPVGESIHFSLSDGDNPLQWSPLWNGAPVLRSNLGTTGVRDPLLVRDREGGFHILATDLLVHGGDEAGWPIWRRHGSLSLIVWHSDDLITWSEPESIQVSEPTAGMTWAPEVTHDPETGDFIVFWSSRIFDEDDTQHEAPSYSRIMYSRTTNFRTFSRAEVMIDAGRDIIDTAIIHHQGKVYRINKDESDAPDSLKIYQERGSSLFANDFEVVSSRIGYEHFTGLEAPIIIQDGERAHWYLFLDQYSANPQGYWALETSDLDSGVWTRVAPDRLKLEDGVKHGTILRLQRDEWERLRAYVVTE